MERGRPKTDITDPQRGEPSLPEIRWVLSLAMRGGMMGAWSRDMTTNVVWWSQELEEIFGLEPGGFDQTQMGFHSLVHEDDLPALEEAVEGAVRSQTDYAIEFRFRHASGEWRWMEGRGRAAYDSSGRPIMLYGIGMDITRRRQAERDHAYMAAVVSSSSDAIISKTLQGIITSWNEGAEHIFGYTAAEAVGQPITIIIPPERQDEERGILERLRRGECVEHFETVRLTREGNRIDISVTISPVRDEKGRIIGASKVARDISERKRSDIEREQLLERERAARTRAEEASHLKNEFLATVSHELRTPLNAIMGWARMLSEGSLDEAKARHAAEVIERNARTQAQLIEDLLDVSSIITGKLRLNVGPVMPAAVLEAALDSVKPAADAKGIRITSALDSEAGPLSGDSNRLQQVIWNLLTNAIKFTPRGGRIEVRLSRAGSHLEITVSDTGQGIAPRFLPHVFDRFRQEDASSTRRHGGLGLGLTIVRHIVELHGGTVTADSPGEGMGATFTVVLPVAALPKPQDVEREPARVEPGRDRVPLDQAPSLERVRVLIVDDEPSMRAVLREALEQRGAEVRDAGSSRQAMEQVQEWRPHLVVSDIAMPVEDGYEFIRRLREWERYEKTRIPAVALTAYTRPEDQARALEAGFQVHLAKPIDPMELVLVLSSLQKWSSNGAGVR